jgi:lincosamide nucleotidyltransferase A/C/D/E
VIRASDVVDLHRRLTERGIDWCIVGGWGVDALVGEQTRPHKDLDVLLSLAAMNEALSTLAEQGFHLAYAWEESQPLVCGDPLVGMPAPSAFVLDHRDGRQVDVHVYDVREGRVSALWDTDRTLQPADLAAAGTIDAVEVRCMSAAMQLVCHQGYQLPAAQVEDVRLLQRLVGSARG